MKEVMISKIDKTSDKIYNYWNEIKNNQMSKLREKWDDSVSEEYIKEVNKVDGVVNKILDRLEDLKEMWERHEEYEEVKDNYEEIEKATEGEKIIDLSD